MAPLLVEVPAHVPGPRHEACGKLWEVLLELPLADAFRFSVPRPPVPLATCPAGGMPKAAPGTRARWSPGGAIGGNENEQCPQCGLPVGDFGYAGVAEGRLLHGECKALLLLQHAKAEELARQRRDAELKAKHRAEYDIGWKAHRIPTSMSVAKRLGCEPIAQGMCCIALTDGSRSVRVAPTANAAAAVNLEYLSIALRVRREEGGEPRFSLDPRRDAVSLSDDSVTRWQVKRFEPAWLEGTSAGEVLFQADYHLKELSMGEAEQPVVGMMGCLDLPDVEAPPDGWLAREWYVVRRAELHLAEGGALVPRVEMGVEAREMVRGAAGLEDAPLTRREHPLVRYAAAFTHFFDLIAERRSVVHHLRELAKASVLAKFLLDGGRDLDESWFHPAGGAKTSGCPLVPQLWNERSHSQVCVRDGEILDAGTQSGTSMHGVYGGVQLSLEQLSLSRKTLQPFSAPSWFPQGVDLSLDTFDLSVPASSAPNSHQGTQTASLPRGSAFWSCVDSGHPPRFGDKCGDFFRRLFNPHLSDRRCEGDSFVGPDTSPAYLQQLRDLMGEEDSFQERRMGHFLSDRFVAERPGPLFPASWTPASSFEISRGPVPEALARQPEDAPLRARPDLQTEALCYVWQGVAPVFDRCAEDGARFRIYRAGQLEVRTTQAPGGAELLGAVFTSGEPSPRAPAAERRGLGSAALGELSRAMLYVEAATCGGSALAAHFYVVLETSRGDAAVTEELDDGTVAWVENPAGLEARNARAKVMRSTDCRGGGATLRDVRKCAAALGAHLGSKCYAQHVFDMALPGTRDVVATSQLRAVTPKGALECEDLDDYSDLIYAF